MEIPVGLRGALEPISIRRQGSYYYTSGYRKLVGWGEVIYLVIGAGLGALAAVIFDSPPAGAIVASLILLNVALIWILYSVVLWYFKRESRQTLEITDTGIMEMADGRQRLFMPWTAVSQIEFNATLFAGASIRIKGRYSDITITNQDIVITRPMRIREMHAALGQLGPIRDLLKTIRSSAPDAVMKFNKLAQWRYKETEV